MRHRYTDVYRIVYQGKDEQLRRISFVHCKRVMLVILNTKTNHSDDKVGHGQIRMSQVGQKLNEL
jgi:hypothetical protein